VRSPLRLRATGHDLFPESRRGLPDRSSRPLSTRPVDGARIRWSFPQFLGVDPTGSDDGHAVVLSQGLQVRHPVSGHQLPPTGQIVGTIFGRALGGSGLGDEDRRLVLAVELVRIHVPSSYARGTLETLWLLDADAASKLN